MTAFLTVTWWEFVRHFKSRSFLFSTFISPVIFAVIILVPTLYLDDPAATRIRVVGCVEFESTGYCQEIRQRFLGSASNSPDFGRLQFVPVRLDTSDRMKRQFEFLLNRQVRLDSLEDAYNTVKERRKFIFQKPKTASRELLLRTSYEEQIQVRETRDLALLEYRRAKQTSDSLWQAETIRYADYLLNTLKLEGYLLIDPEMFSRGIVEFYSILPANFLEIEPVKQAAQVVIVEQRLKQEGLRVDKIHEWLEPIVFREIQLQGEEKQETDFLINYLGPIIVVLFLFISIFTSSGFLFSGVLKEKTNRVIELLLSSVSHGQLVTGKILGLGFLGIFQIIIWFTLTLILVLLNILDSHQLTFLSWQNAGFFLLYFILGYLFFASIFVGIGSLFSHEEDAHHLSQFMRLLSVFPIVLAILVLDTPHSLLVRILSFIPPLTPTFMILRTPLASPPPEDYIISVTIMIASIVLSIFFAGKLFKVGVLLYGKKPGFREIMGVVFNRTPR